MVKVVERVATVVTAVKLIWMCQWYNGYIRIFARPFIYLQHQAFNIVEYLKQISASSAAFQYI